MIRRVVDTPLQNTTAVAMGGNLNTVRSDSIVNELVERRLIQSKGIFENMAYLVIFWGQLVEALLDNVIAVQVLDEHNNVKAECDNDGMYLSIVSEISLLSCPVSVIYEINEEIRLACLRVERKSIIF
jgi:hypothetical protein